jgi:small GTP-binding protein
MNSIASESVNYDHIFKIILVGDNGVGKSSIIRRFCEGSYANDMDTTIGVDFYLSEIEVNGKKIKVKIWDTAGSEKYMSISAVYYRKADGVIFVFDMTRPRSFTNVVSVWMNAVEAQERSVRVLINDCYDIVTCLSWTIDQIWHCIIADVPIKCLKYHLTIHYNMSCIASCNVCHVNGMTIDSQE